MAIVPFNGSLSAPQVFQNLSGISWQGIVDRLIQFFVADDRPFSSGEIAAYIRWFAPSIRFSVMSLGEYVRNKYDNGEFPNSSTGLYPVQVARVTQGTSRTLDGRTVKSRTPVGPPAPKCARWQRR